MRNPAEFREKVIECLIEYLPELKATEIKDDMHCGRHLGIDSHMGLELACEFSLRLGVEIGLEDNPLVRNTKTGGERMRTVGELLQHLSTLLPN
jgi:acyl carrier protein